jgi:hypothetical protein
VRCQGLLAGVLALLLVVPTRAQSLPEVSFPITVRTDAGGAQELSLGLDPDATDGIDGALGETEQPPLPPSGIFDARLIDDDIPVGDVGQGLVDDYRPGSADFSGTKEHEIQIQPETEATQATVHWALPDGVSGTLTDVVTDGGQVDVPMSGSGSYTLTNLNLDKLYVTLDYSGSQVPVTIRSARITSAEPSSSLSDIGSTVQASGVETDGTVVGKKFPAAPSGTMGIVEENVSDYRFEMTPGMLSATELDVQFSMDALDGADDPAAVQVYRRSPPGSGSFQSVPTELSQDGSAVVTTPVLDSLTELVMASDTQPLPVALTAFTARPQGEEVVLEWRTASETNNAGFSVQHQRPGTGLWESAGFVESRAPGGTTTEPQHYQYLLRDTSPGTHRFRLRQVDLDGAAHLSDPVQVTVELQEALRLDAPAPNPARETAQLSYAVRERRQTTLHLYNVLGERVSTVYAGTPAPGELHTARVDVSALSSGVYVLRLAAGGHSASRRLVVVR